MRRGIAYQSTFVAAVLSLCVSTLPAADSDRPPIEAPRPGAVASGGAAAAETTGLIPDGAEEFMPSKGKAAKTGTDALGGNEEWMEDPFKNIGSDMKTIVSDLGATETHVPSTETQPRVLSRLDVLIAQLEKACKKGGGGAAGGNPTSPANKSTLGGGPGGKGELRAPGDSRKKWAELTPKEREKILQSQTQGFPAGYEDLLAEYFRRLSQGKTVAAATDDASSGNETPANRPSKPSTGADK
jgi:hypothetical protein